MKPRLAIFDFDGTGFDTSAPGPLQTDVKRAYAYGIRDVLGERALAQYEAEGGLRNRAPLEVVQALLQVDEQERNRRIHAAREFYEINRPLLDAMMVDHKGVNISVWDEKRAGTMVTEIVIRQKLYYLLNQIEHSQTSSEGFWPQPMPGFVEFWTALNQKKSEGAPIATAIISSGHDVFIKRTFDMWRLPQPDYLVTEDDIRDRHFPTDLARRVKPGQLQLALVHRAWLHDTDWRGFDVSHLLETRKHMIYFGDDGHKDGGLARGAGIVFGHITPPTESEDIVYIWDEHHIEFHDWSQMIEPVLEDQDMSEGHGLWKRQHHGRGVEAV